MCEVCGCDPCDCDGVNDEFRFLGTDGTTETPKEYNLASTQDRITSQSTL